MNRCRKQQDAAWRTVKKTLDRLQPNLHINIHNWTNKWRDGLLCNSDALMEHIRVLMPSQERFLKTWYLESHASFLNYRGIARTPPENASWKNYLAEKYGCQGVTFEYPWFGRTTADMRKVGRDTLVATLAGYLKLHER